MDIDKIRKEIMFRAEKTLYYSELVIRQCDSWETSKALPQPAPKGRKDLLSRCRETSFLQKFKSISIKNNFKIVYQFFLL